MLNVGYPQTSCIKIVRKTQNVAVPKFDPKDAMKINNELISLANRIFGEENWSHTITNQTLDFSDSFKDKHVCGCVTFVKIQLCNGIFHEDMGYCHAEEATKALAIYSARISSLTNAFKKVLMCFGGRMEAEVHNLMQKVHNGTPSSQKDDLQFLQDNMESESLLQPCAQSTPYACATNSKIKEKEVVSRPVSPRDRNGISSTKLKPLDETKKQVILPTDSSRIKNPNDIKGEIISSYANIPQNKQDPADVSKNDELMRLERKRKQLEKQIEYKRLMQEKECQKSVQIKKPNPKY